MFGSVWLGVIWFGLFGRIWFDLNNLRCSHGWILEMGGGCHCAIRGGERQCNEMETMQWAALGGHKVMRASKGFS